jgi:tetratricopeptide (TPR) repeat protein
MRAGYLFLIALSCTSPVLALAQPAPAKPAERRAELDRLLSALAASPDETAGSAIEARIRTLWMQRATPAVTLLIARGQRNMEAEAFGDAVEDFDAALTLQPDFADAWLMRAQALSALGDNTAALQDVRQVLVLEPRHFGALAMLSRLQEQAGDLAGALRAMQAAVALHPHMAGADARLRDLRRRALGEDT